MFTSEFNIYHLSSKEQVQVKIEQEDEILFVSVNGDYLGSMVEDSEAEFGYSTDDEKLESYMESISMHFKDVIKKNQLADKLSLKYGEVIGSVNFINDEILEVIVHEDFDLCDFGGVVKDEIYDLVEFESALTIVLSQENTDQTVEVEIN